MFVLGDEREYMTEAASTQPNAESNPSLKRSLGPTTATFLTDDALYAYCQEMLRRGKPDGAFR